MAKRGPKPIPIDPNEVQHLASIGCTPEEIAVLVSPESYRKLLDADHLEKKFHAVVKRGKMQLHRSLKHELVTRALNGNTAALIFALKAYCRLSDNPDANQERNHLVIHFDHSSAVRIEERAVPIREAVTNMLSNYRKDIAQDSTSTPLLTDSDS